MCVARHLRDVSDLGAFSCLTISELCVLVLFSCNLPSDNLPPSYSGSAIKYSNAFSLVLQKSVSSLAGPPTILTLPFRVLNPTAGLRRNDIVLGCPSAKYAPSTKAFMPADPISSLELQSARPAKAIKDKDTRRLLKAVFEKLGKPGTCRDSVKRRNRILMARDRATDPVRFRMLLVCIKVNKATDHLATFTVERTVFELGDVVRGYIDFSKATIPSYFLSMKLELLEEVAPEYFANHPGRPSAVTSKTIAEAEEVLHATRSTNFEFHLPLSATPTFASELISVRWLLKFELVAASSLPSPSTDKAPTTATPATVTPPRSSEVERMSWQVPIRVLVASHPIDLIEHAKASKTWAV